MLLYPLWLGCLWLLLELLAKLLLLLVNEPANRLPLWLFAVLFDIFEVFFWALLLALSLLGAWLTSYMPILLELLKVLKMFVELLLIYALVWFWAGGLLAPCYGIIELLSCGCACWFGLFEGYCSGERTLLLKKMEYCDSILGKTYVLVTPISVCVKFGMRW